MIFSHIDEVKLVLSVEFFQDFFRADFVDLRFNVRNEFLKRFRMLHVDQFLRGALSRHL